MKKIVFIFSLLLLVTTLSAQESADTMYISLSKGRVLKFSVEEIYSMGFTPVVTPEYPVADNAVSLVYSPGWDGNKTKLAKNVYDLLTKAGIECTNTMGSVQITDDEYQEIKEFTDELVKGLTTQKAIYDKCFSWVASNLKYRFEYENGSGVVDNNPYPVFKTKQGICQGYANLLFVMLHGQGVPVLICNGFIPEGGHAWNYVNCDGTWYVSDPTNNRYQNMSNYTSYASTFMPTSLDAKLFEDDNFQYDYTNARLNVRSIESEEEVLVVPYSIEGFKITQLNPNYVSPNIKELYVGKNIEIFADVANGHILGLKVNAPNLEYIHVDPNSPYFKSYEGVVYSKENNMIVVIPSAMKSLKMLAVEKIEKGVVDNAESIEELYVAEGTLSIEAYAFCDCPNLKVAYIPQNTEVDSEAFFNVHKDFQIVRY